jgi:hypothetical protein
MQCRGRTFFGPGLAPGRGRTWIAPMCGLMRRANPSLNPSLRVRGNGVGQRLKSDAAGQDRSGSACRHAINHHLQPPRYWRLGRSPRRPMKIRVGFSTLSWSCFHPRSRRGAGIRQLPTPKTPAASPFVRVDSCAHWHRQHGPTRGTHVGWKMWFGPATDRPWAPEST